MKVLVTGGCGFLGSNIAASYLDAGAEVVVIDALFRKGSESNLGWLRSKASAGRLHFFQLDVADESGVDAVFQAHAPFDYVCHLGGQVAMTTSLSDPRRDLRTNVVGTFNVLESVRRHCPGALVAYSSTNKVYGDLERIKPVEGPTRYTLPGYPEGLDETLSLDFASPYGCSKGSADQYVRDWHRNYGLKTVVFRHSSIYGGRQFATFDQGWIGWFCQKALEQRRALAEGRETEAFTISGTGKQVRDVLHADDLIRLYQAAYENRDKVAGHVYNIGGGISNSLSLLELFGLLEDLLEFPAGTHMKYTRLPRRQSDQDFFVADVRLAGSELGWTPRKSCREGIRAMLDWIAKSHQA